MTYLLVAMTASDLTVEFAGHRRDFDAATPSVVFGRGAEIDVDSNPFLHRQVGRLVTVGDLWWIECLGRETPLSISSDGATATLSYGKRAALTHAAAPLPSNAAAAERLGWSTAKYNRKLDWLCQKLHRLGVAGMRAQGRRANHRRRLLVDYVIRHGIVTEAQLSLLDDPGDPPNATEPTADAN